MTTNNGHANGTPTANTEDKRFREMQDLVFNVITMRQELYRRYLDPRRDLDRECGYPDPSTVDARRYYDIYDAEPVAARVVEILPEECMSVQPEIIESEDPNEETEFEQAVADLAKTLRGEESWFNDPESSPLWEYVERADTLSGVGNYGVILLGLDDGLPLSQPVKGIIEEGSVPGETRNKGKRKRYNLTINKQQTANRKLVYMSVFPEHLAQITQWENNPASPRYNKPVMYLVTFNDPKTSSAGQGAPRGTELVHWTRIVHIADNLGSSEVIGVPRLRRVLHPVLDIMKVRGGSAEGHWQGAFPGLSLETHPQLGGDVNVSQDNIRNMMENYSNSVGQRWLTLMGMSAKTLSPNVTQPGPFIDIQVDAICIKIACPKRIFVGSERGELASSQDTRTWNGRIRKRRFRYVTPRIIVPMIDRLIQVGVLPQPSGWLCKWPKEEQLDPLQQSQRASSRVQAMGQYVSMGLDSLIDPMDFLSREMGYTDEEAEQILQNSSETAEGSQTEEEEPAGDPQVAAQSVPSISGLLTQMAQGAISESAVRTLLAEYYGDVLDEGMIDALIEGNTPETTVMQPEVPPEQTETGADDSTLQEDDFDDEVSDDLDPDAKRELERLGVNKFVENQPRRLVEILLNCGGVGGKPGPCPTFQWKEWQKDPKTGKQKKPKGELWTANDPAKIIDQWRADAKTSLSKDRNIPSPEQIAAIGAAALADKKAAKNDPNSPAGKALDKIVRLHSQLAAHYLGPVWRSYGINDGDLPAVNPKEGQRSKDTTGLDLTYRNGTWTETASGKPSRLGATVSEDVVKKLQSIPPQAFNTGWDALKKEPQYKAVKKIMGKFPGV